MSTLISGRGAAKRKPHIGLLICALLALAAAQPSKADTGFVIGHASPVVAAADRDLTVSAVITSTCTVAHCGDIRLVVVYLVPGGSRFASAMMPAAKLQLGKVTIPGVHVRVPSIAYRLAAYQERCFFMNCSTASATTSWYTVPVRRM